MSELKPPPELPIFLTELSKEQLVDMCHRLHASQMSLFRLVQSCEARLAAKPEPQEENPVIQVMRTASWKSGDVALSWVPGVPYVEITIERCVTKATARMHVKDVLQLQEALSIAFNESNKLGCSVPLASEETKP